MVKARTAAVSLCKVADPVPCSGLPKRSERTGAALMLAVMVMLWMSPGAMAAQAPRHRVTKIVTQIQRADYEGDRAALRRLFEELAPFVGETELAAPVRYWRGFALWRRAINGFNETVDAREQERDLLEAVDEFDAAASKEPGFVDARVGKLSCLGYAMYVNQANPARLQELAARLLPLLKQLQAEAPDNPRLLWVLGPTRWREREGGQDKAIAGYQKGLEVLRNRKQVEGDPLLPSWGEPELLMNLAWSHLNKTTPDVTAAKRYANEALKLVPYWHYLRDILLRQIQDAEAKRH